MNQIDKVLTERGSRYGDFSNHAQVAQKLQDALRSAGEKTYGEGWDRCSAVQKQALSVICDKLARIVSGDPNYDDNWIDIQGYAKLAQDRLPRQGELFDAKEFKHGLAPAPFARGYGLGSRSSTSDLETERSIPETAPTCVCY